MIELNIYLFFFFLEVIFALLVVVAVLIKRIKKYKPYYEANTSPQEYFKKYFSAAIKFTRSYAQKINFEAENGDKLAIKRRKYMVARLNWLVLERDFIATSKPIPSYWDDINFRIKKMLTRWTEAEFISELPDGEIVTRALRNTSDEDSDDLALSSRKSTTDASPEESRLRERIQYLEKQVIQLSSYKTLFEGLQNTYDSLKQSYKKLKEAIQSLELSSDDAERLKQIINDHESAESVLDAKLKDMEDQQNRLNAELQQLEAAFETLENEQLETEEKRARELEDMATLQAEPAAVDLNVSIEVVDNLEIAIRELRGAVNAVELDTEVKLELDDQIQGLGVQTNEIKTCFKTLEMENNRMQQELTQLKSEAP